MHGTLPRAEFFGVLEPPSLRPASLSLSLSLPPSLSLSLSLARFLCLSVSWLALLVVVTLFLHLQTLFWSNL